MTKMDMDEGDWKKLKEDFQCELGIDGNCFIPLVNYKQEELSLEEPEMNPDIDVLLLKMMNKVINLLSDMSVVSQK